MDKRAKIKLIIGIALLGIIGAVGVMAAWTPTGRIAQPVTQTTACKTCGNEMALAPRVLSQFATAYYLWAKDGSPFIDQATQYTLNTAQIAALMGITNLATPPEWKTHQFSALPSKVFISTLTEVQTSLCPRCANFRLECGITITTGMGICLANMDYDEDDDATEAKELTFVLRAMLSGTQISLLAVDGERLKNDVIVRNYLPVWPQARAFFFNSLEGFTRFPARA